MADSSLVYIPLKFRHIFDLCQYYDRILQVPPKEGSRRADYARVHQESLDACRDFLSHFRTLQSKSQNPEEQLAFLNRLREKLKQILDTIEHFLTETEEDLEDKAEDDPSRVYAERAENALKLLKNFFDDFVGSLDRLLSSYRSAAPNGGSVTNPRILRLLKQLWQRRADKARAYLAVAQCPRARL